MNEKNHTVLPYLKIARIDHWPKNLFMLPGVAIALSCVKGFGISPHIMLLIFHTSVAFFALCLASSANYIMNEWVDRNYDMYHPLKSKRASVLLDLNFKIICVSYVAVALLSLLMISFNRTQLFWIFLLLVMGAGYNLPPVRFKDIPYIDVISESLNNAIRMALGWYCVPTNHVVPGSAFISFWAGGAFLMSLKRYVEVKSINDKILIQKYRPSLSKWNSNNLLAFSMASACLSTAGFGIFVAGYRLEYILLIPIFCFLFFQYFGMSLRLNDAVYAPEKLWQTRNLYPTIMIALIVGLILTFVNIPSLQAFAKFVH